MKITDIIKKETIIPDLAARDKKGVLDELVAPVGEITGISSDELVRVLLERERLGSTGIGGGVGIPHGKIKGLDNLVLGFGLSKGGVDFDSMDGKPTRIFFLLITPENSTVLHLNLLARISRLLKDDSFRQSLLNSSSAEEIFEVIKEADTDF